MVDKSDEVPPSPHKSHGVEMIRSRVALAFFRALVERPLMVLLVWHLLIPVCVVLTSRYNSMRSRHLEVPSLHTRLKFVQDTLRQEFKLGGSNSSFESVVIWSDTGERLLSSHNFIHVHGDIDQVLRDLKAHGPCPSAEDMEWQGFSPYFPSDLASRFLSEDGSASVLLIKHPCTKAVGKALVPLDRKHGGLRVALGTPTAVMEASVDETSENMMSHMFMCAPFMLVLLWLNTGSVFRAATAFICLIMSLLGTDAICAILKWLRGDLNFSNPDQAMMFVMLALCLDYGLFFWTRFSQERKKDPDTGKYQQALMTTLTTSGAVIAVSVAVLVIGYLAMCFYPDQNAVGSLATSLQLIIGINLLGLYSLVIPATLASQFPSVFDEKFGKGGTSCMSKLSDLFDRVTVAGHELYKGMFTRFSFFITSQPWMILMPLLVYAIFVPALVELRDFAPNFDTIGATISKNVVEYEAFQILTTKFNVGRADPVLVLLQADLVGPVPARPTGDAMAMLQVRVRVGDTDVAGEEAVNVSLTPGFREMACRYVSSIIDGTNGTAFQISAHDVQSVWWDAATGTCAPTPLVDDLEHRGSTSQDGRMQVLRLFPVVHRTSKEMEEMTRYFWKDIEPKAKGTFEAGGQQYSFQARHYSYLADIMLMEERFAHRAPWLLASLVAVICIVVGLLFGSAGLGLKMVVTVVVPIAAEFGFVVGVYQHGWLEWAGVPRTGGLSWTHFYTSMGLLLGLAIDYDIFLFARVYERRQEGFDNLSAVRMAIAETGSVITVAGTMMCISFFFVALCDIYFISQLGMLYFVGVALDTYIVRTFLAPAILCMSERVNYWPGKVPPAKLTWDGDVSKLGR